MLYMSAKPRSVDTWPGASADVLHEDELQLAPDAPELESGLGGLSCADELDGKQVQSIAQTTCGSVGSGSGSELRVHIHGAVPVNPPAPHPALRLDLSRVQRESKSLEPLGILASSLRIPTQTPTPPPASVSSTVTIWDGVGVDLPLDFRSLLEGYSRETLFILEWLRKIAMDYALPKVSADPKKLATLVLESAAGYQPRLPDLLATIINLKDCAYQLSRPGQRFRGPDGYNQAAAHIQAKVRGVQARRMVRRMLRQRTAAQRIQAAWRRRHLQIAYQMQAATAAQQRLTIYEALQLQLSRSWTQMQCEPHVILYLIPALNSSPAAILPRLCSLSNPLLRVICVTSPAPDPELRKIWTAFLEAGGAPEPGHRFHLIVPENSARLPSGMTLSAQLLASPRALKRIRLLRHGMPSYIIPAKMTSDEVELSSALAMGVLAGTPAVHAALTSRATARSIFGTAGVAYLPSIPVEAAAARSSSGPASSNQQLSEGRLESSKLPIPGHMKCAACHPTQAAWREMRQPLLPNATPEAKVAGSIGDATSEQKASQQQQNHDVTSTSDGAAASATEQDITSATGPGHGASQHMNQCSAVLLPQQVEPNPALPQKTVVTHYDVIIAEAVAEAMLCHPQVTQWLLKINHVHGSRGHALLHVSRLSNRARQQAASPGLDPVQRSERQVLLAEACSACLPAAVEIGNSNTFKSWHKFARSLCSKGGLIESNVKRHGGSPSVNMLLEPTGAVSILSTHEQIFCPARNRIASSMPATSVRSEALYQAAVMIGRICWAAGLWGEMSVDFLVVPSKTDSTSLVAVDLKPSAQAPLLSYKLFHFLQAGHWDPWQGIYTFDAEELAAEVMKAYALQLATPSAELLETVSLGDVDVLRTVRCCVAIDGLMQPSLELFSATDFLRRCHLANIGFSMSEGTGTTLHIMHQMIGRGLGIICSSQHLKTCFLSILQVLSELSLTKHEIECDASAVEFDSGKAGDFHAIFSTFKHLCSQLN